ncbi:MAG TPA: hypothetical protein PKE40_01135 [Arachnia sp.]|nr:hypothetical protein [Arachnia sp.]HMT84931.1 hypothetical protein [Arachnia sp.]
MVAWRKELDDGMLRCLVADARREASRLGKNVLAVELEDKLIRTLDAAAAKGYLLTDMELAAVLSTYVCNSEICPRRGSDGIHG